MKTRIVQNIKDRSKIAFANSTYWFHAKMHEEYGTSFSWAGKGASGDVSGTQAISGTTNWQAITANTTNITGAHVDFASNGSAAGNGTLSFTAATSTFTWAENGDTAGAGVAVSADGVITLASSNGNTITVTVDFSALPGTDQADTITVASVGGPFYNRGEFTSAGDNGTIITSGTLFNLLNDICRTDNLDGTIMCFFRASTALNVSPEGWLFSFNNAGNASNGYPWSIRITNARKVQVIYGNFIANVLTSTILDTNNTDVLFGFYIHRDATTGQVSLAVSADGVQETTNTETLVCQAAPRIGFFCYPNNSDVAQAQMKPSARQSEILFFRSNSDLRSDFEAIGESLVPLRGSLSWILDGK